MANLGNAWHIPGSPEPRGRAGMRDPVGAIVPGTTVTMFSGNQFQGAGNPGNQLQTGSSLSFKRAADADWTSLPLIFHSTAGNNKYYSATLPAGTFQTGDVIQYYFRIAYDDHDTTFLHAKDDTSTPAADEAAARAAPFTFAVERSDLKGQWGPVFKLPNVAIHTHVLPNGLVLMWGRRDNPMASLDVHECTPFLWNPVTGEVTNTPQPKLANGSKVNLFCSGPRVPSGRPSSGSRRPFGRQRWAEPSNALRLDHKYVDTHCPDDNSYRGASAALVPDCDNFAQRQRTSPVRQLH